MKFDISYDFPVESAFSKDQTEQQFWKCLYTSAKQEMLHYWVVLPKALRPAQIEPVEVSDVGLTNIGRYLTTDSSPYLEVWAAYERCQWEMNASDWLLKKLTLMGEKILHQRIIDSPSGSGKFADVLTTKKYYSGDEVISRYTVQKDYNRKDSGGNYFLLKASCASRDYASLANEIYLIVVSWDLLHRSNLALAELLSNVNLGEHGAFKVPSSWKAKAIADNRLVIEHTIDNINYGVVNLYFYSDKDCHSPEEAFRRSTMRFHSQDTSISFVANELEFFSDKMNSEIDDIFTCTGEIRSPKDNMRAIYQAYIFKLSGLWCYVELVGRHRNKNDYYFEANKRCVEIIISTIYFRMAPF